MKREIKILFQITAAIICCLFASCVETTFQENYPNGTAKYVYKTRGDHGTITSAKMGDSGSSGGIPVLGSRNRNDYDITQAAANGESWVKVGDNFEQRGTLTHSTGMGVVAKATVRGIREVILGVIGWKGLHTWGQNEAGKRSADIAKTQSGDGVKMNDSNNSLKGLESNNATKVELEALKLE